MNEPMSYIRYRTYGLYEISHPESYQVHFALNYAGDGSSLHTLHLSVPEKVENPPLIVIIPGGGSTGSGTMHPSPHRTGPASRPNGSHLF